MDTSLYLETLERPSSSPYIISKEVLYCVDQNGSAYNGQITLDTSIIGNSLKWASYREAYLEIPYIITLKSSADIDAAGIVNSFVVGLKNGNHQVLDSIQVIFNNNTVVQSTPFTNIYVGYKLMSTFSADDVYKNGPTIGFCPDTAGSFTYSAGASVYGEGLANNVVSDDSYFGVGIPTYPGEANTGASRLTKVNTGFLQRLKYNGYPLMSGVAMGYGGLDILNTTALANTVARSYLSRNGSADAARVWQWNLLLTVRLKDICDFFDKIPLVKGSFMRFIINYNAAEVAITNTLTAGDIEAEPPTADTVTMIRASAVQMKSGRTCPFMIAAGSTGNPSSSIPTGTLTIASGIGTQYVTNAFEQMILPSVRLNVPSYVLSPEYEAELLRMMPTRKVKYNDIFNYPILAVSAGGTFNAILTNGLANPVEVVVVPVLNNVAGNAATASLTPYQSPFDTCPATTTPCAYISNFNILVSGKNVFQQNFNYTYETYINELSSFGAINGNLDTGLTSGLINKFDFENGYGYHVANLSRFPKTSIGVPQSVSVVGTNNTSKIMDYMTFIVFEREIEINMVTGGLLM